ncbi:uncharacterized protein BX664DRAFT_326379 [Halteromyces radiatus]|uniref:uncharacterized protein n=1 Tax=Halteromyces radiatus TaxID=101107 RepID=UPI00221FB951|nr:uncharacterized protein BX664DRAFT_326379 [Halteromyces radiatus]KAI8097444.1 hypothetical protein BX664DRAFT_326379 [Halteromyces radiatus]
MVTTEEEDIDDEDEEDGDFSYEDEFMDYNEDNNNDDDDDDNDEDDEDDDMLDEDERMKHNIVAARHLTIHESQRQDNTFYANPPFLSSSPPTPHSRSRSMTTSNAANYIPYQYQRQQSQQSPEEWPLSAGFQETTYYHHQSENQQQRPRRHTADVSVLDRVPWGEFPLSMGVDAVEAATVLTLLKRS